MGTYQYRCGDRPLEGYTIQRAAGRGGFGEVYYALSNSGRQVAIKAIQSHEQIELRGISQCMNLKSPHLVTIFDVRHNDQGRPFVIMEYVSGPSLADLLKESPGGLGSQKAAFFLREIGKGLSFLHECGIVHRDLKPGNIFYENGYVKIGDYGLTKAISASRHISHTMTVGTVHYMAPEIGAGRYDRSIDIYALGVLLYEMLMGQVPFLGASPAEILMKHMTATADLTNIEEPFARVIRKALAKDPAERYQSVQEMVEDVFGTEHVRNSVSQFAPEELSVVAEHIAQKIHGAQAQAKEAEEIRIHREEERQRRTRLIESILAGVTVPVLLMICLSIVFLGQKETNQQGIPVQRSGVSSVAQPQAHQAILNSIGMKLVWIPPGEFLMGSPDLVNGPARGEGRQHRVKLTTGFYLGTHEVTQRQWQAVMGSNPSHFKGYELPVDNVSWEEVLVFCQKLSAKEGAEYRLPTEAEWEYACRAGSAGRYSFGDNDSALDEYAWYDTNSRRQTHAVGQKKPNGWGLYDMHGNVSEWCQDWYEVDASGLVTNPTGLPPGFNRVARGGDWSCFAAFCRSSSRLSSGGGRVHTMGFRLLRTASSHGRLEAAKDTGAGRGQANWPLRGVQDSGVPGVAKPHPGQVITNSVGVKMVWIPPGEFLMGSPNSEKGPYYEGPQHRVKLTTGFYLGVYEVTQRQWQAVMGCIPGRFKGYELPVEVCWDDAVTFCLELSAKEGVEYRLPMEAEWEYACRAGSTSRYSFGDIDSGLGDYAWYGPNSGGQTHPVGQKKPNVWGLYDMYGNVAEWCQDWYVPYTSGSVTDPLGAAEGDGPVARGGAHNYNAIICHSASRDMRAPENRRDVGLRLVRTTPSYP